MPNGFPFDTHLADLSFFSLLFFRLRCYLYGLGLELGLGFIFYV